MKRSVLALTIAAIVLGYGSPGLRAPRANEVWDSGEVGLGLMLRQLSNAGTLMFLCAHPDDENNTLLAYLDRGLGFRTVVAAATRGNGGQDEIGPELFEALAVLRTEELLAVHQYDGAEQLFTRAVDFGYSFSTEETFEKWGRREILGDFVRLIRTVRPDVITAMRPDGDGGGQHHQASAILAREAFRAAGDPTQFPEQLADGLRPWQASKFYFTASFGFRGESAPPAGVRLTTVDVSGTDPLIGRTYPEIGSIARSQHKSQGMAQLLTLPDAPVRIRYRLVDTVIPGQMERDETSLFDGIDVSVGALARFAGDRPPDDLKTGLTKISDAVAQARGGIDETNPSVVIPHLLSGLTATRQLRRALPQSGIPDAGLFEIDMRLARKEREFERALTLAAGVQVHALSDDGLVTPGQPLKVTTLVANGGGEEIRVASLALSGFDAAAGCPGQTLRRGQSQSCVSEVHVPPNARVTEPYFETVPGVARDRFAPDATFGAPFRPTPFVAQIELEVRGEPVRIEQPVLYRYEGNIFSGEKRMELKVVPVFSVTVTPEIAIVPTGEPMTTMRRTAGPVPADREVRVTVINGIRGAAPTTGEVALVLPQGWKASPQSETVTFARDDESRTVRFSLKPPAGLAAGEYRVGALARRDGETFTRGYQVVEYPHIQRRHLYWPAEARLKAIDVKVAPALTVGYVMGVGDEVPQAIQQLGATLDMLGPDELGWGNLARYDAIVTGVRAYERRADLRANNHRLIQYVEQGGVAIVQYNKFEFNEAQYGPYPAKVSSNRVTDENAPVQVLVPDHPVFTFPNRIAADAWRGWVQERGLYFLGERDSRYADLVQLEDPFPYNKGVKRGALVEARHGKGRWIYVGLGLWRQLPAGTDGAYQLLANLLSLGKSKAIERRASNGRN